MAAKVFKSAVGIFGHAAALETVVIAPSLTKEIVTLGSGSERPPRGSNVKAHYVGKLLSGEDFDSSRKRGRPFTFDIGAGRVIKGWDVVRAPWARLPAARRARPPATSPPLPLQPALAPQGIATMLKGEKAVFTVSKAPCRGQALALGRAPSA